MSKREEPKELAVANHGVVNSPPAMLRPLASAEQMIEYHQQLTDIITRALVRDRDYGVIPRTSDKPVLLKPGAERLAVAFGCYPRYEIIEKEIDHAHKNQWSKYRDGRVITGESLGLYRYVVRCTLVHRASGEPVGDGLASASSLESKYIDRPRDLENTILKMAQKRALVAAVLNTFGLSDRFTQDLEDDLDVPQAIERAKNGGATRTEQLKQRMRNGSSPSPLRQLYDKYRAAGGTDAAWKVALAEVGVTPDVATQTAERLQLLGNKLGLGGAPSAEREMEVVEI